MNVVRGTYIPVFYFFTFVVCSTIIIYVATYKNLFYIFLSLISRNILQYRVQYPVPGVCVHTCTPSFRHIYDYST